MDKAQMKQDDRIHNTDKLWIIFKNVPIHLQNSGMKPIGLWFSFGTQWIDWCEDEMPHWIKPFNYQLIIVGNILKITNEKEFIDFTNEFGIEQCYMTMKIKIIDWSKVCSKYDGIEIADVNDNYNYFSKFRYEQDWYNSWDIGSGCIWNTREVMFNKL